MGPPTRLRNMGSFPPLPRLLPPPLPLGRRCPVAEMVAVRVELVASAVTSCALTAASSAMRLCTIVVSVSTVVLSAAAAVAKFATALAISSSCDTLLAWANAPWSNAAFSLNS